LFAGRGLPGSGNPDGLPEPRADSAALGKLARALEVTAFALPDPVLDLIERIRLRVGEDSPPVVQRLGPCLPVASESGPVEDDGHDAADLDGKVRPPFGACVCGY
jgi:hypothetical protein